MERKSSSGWKFFALLFGALLAAVVGLYIYKQQNPVWIRGRNRGRTAPRPLIWAWPRKPPPRRRLSRPRKPKPRRLRKRPDRGSIRNMDLIRSVPSPGRTFSFRSGPSSGRPFRDETPLDQRPKGRVVAQRLQHAYEGLPSISWGPHQQVRAPFAFNTQSDAPSVGERSEPNDACGRKARETKAYEGTSSLPQRSGHFVSRRAGRCARCARGNPRWNGRS